jgi:serine/threonine protein kinase
MMNTHQADDWQGKMLGRYQLIRMLGRGGMGEVWLAEDTQLRRKVAVKLLPYVVISDQGYLRDFEREARAAAALEHPHILPVHDFGEQPVGDTVITYIIMPYITGGSLRERLHGFNGPLPTDEALYYLRQAAQAIDYAHSQDVLHRDIKPANMLLQRDWLLLADFGISKLLTSSTIQSGTHAGAGTPEYMAPEQAQGKAEFASDRYSLGIVAYQLFAGNLPFKGDTPYGTLMKQVKEEPPPPRQYNPALPEAVEQAILRGIVKRPEDRPASCAAFIRSIEQGWKAGGTAEVDPDATELAPWNKRRQELARPPLQKVILSNGPTIQRVKTPETPESIPETPRPAAYYSPDRATYLSNTPPDPTSYYGYNTPTYQSDLLPFPVPTPSIQEMPSPGMQDNQISRRSLLIGGAGVAATVLVAGGGIALNNLLHFTANNHYAPAAKPGPYKLIKGVPLLVLTGRSGVVWDAVWHPSGRYLATAGEDTFVRLWDIASYLKKGPRGVQSINKPVRSWKLSDSINDNGLCWSSDGRTLAVVVPTVSNKIYLLDAFGSGSTPHVYQDASQGTDFGAPAYSHIAWSPKAITFATSLFSQTRIELWQADHAAGPVRTLLSKGINDPSINVEEVSWSTDGSLVAGLTNSNPVVIWEAATGVVKQVLHLPDRPHPLKFVLRQSLAWSPVDPHLLVISDLDIATLWDVQRNKLLLKLKTKDPVPYVTGLAWSPNGKYVAGGYARSPRVYVWDVQMTGASASLGSVRAPKLFFAGSGAAKHTKAVIDVAWSPDGRYIASAAADNTVIVWKVDAD